MTRLQSSDFEALLQAIRILGEPRTLDAFPGAAMQVARVLIPGISYSYTEVDLEQRRSVGVMDPLDSAPAPDLIAVMNTYVFQHPLIATFAQSHDAGAQMISDFINARDYHRMELYADFYRLLDTDDQMAIQLRTAPNRIVGLVVNRDRRTFNERERTLFTLLHPHLIQSYQNAMAYSVLDDVADSGGQQAIWLASDGRMIHATRGVAPLFDRYFGSRRVLATGLPESLFKWLRCQQARAGSDDLRPLQPLHADGPEGRLSVRLVIGSLGGTILLLLHEQRAIRPDRAFAALGLSPRRTEVVRWVVEGKSSAEIGELLGVKSRTVEKHLEYIFEQLDVTSRAALVARALQSLREG